MLRQRCAYVVVNQLRRERLTFLERAVQNLLQFECIYFSVAAGYPQECLPTGILVRFVFWFLDTTVVPISLAIKKTKNEVPTLWQVSMLTDRMLQF